MICMFVVHHKNTIFIYVRAKRVGGAKHSPVPTKWCTNVGLTNPERHRDRDRETEIDRVNLKI